MDLTILLTCKYIFDEQECRIYLMSINENVDSYAYVHGEQLFAWVINKKSQRKIYHTTLSNLSEYTNLISVRYSDSYNTTRQMILSNTLRCITFGFQFNQQLTMIPDRIIHLTLGYDFNQEIHKLPKKLTHEEDFSTKLTSEGDFSTKLTYDQLCVTSANIWSFLL
jgi:hypothetical protein